jgi:ABC-2 type transport system ATP-binding protein
VSARSVIEVVDLVKRFGDTVAVGGIRFEVAEGEIFGFLGPNGAGKSTTVKILSTLLQPTSGTARVAGHDVVREPQAVRRVLGLLFQDPAVDDRLTARENLRLHAVMYEVPRRERAARIDDALSWMDLAAQGDDLVRTFSGGMRRRLELARALLHRPRILFLDEPTTGLDPQTRRAVWEKLIALRRDEGTTIFMTTHYLEEAENCDRVAIIDHGRLVTEGPPDALRAQAGAERIALSTTDDARAAMELARRLGVAPQRTERGLEFAVESGERFLPLLFGFPVEIRSLTLKKPTLEDAFIALTGHGIRPEEASARDLLRGVVRRRGRLR